MRYNANKSILRPGSVQTQQPVGNQPTRWLSVIYLFVSSSGENHAGFYAFCYAETPQHMHVSLHSLLAMLE